jgi:hypothetical protein
MISERLAEIAARREAPPMATLIDWSPLQARLATCKASQGYDTDHLALTHIFLEQDLGLSPEEILDAITNGGDDRGIDAVYLDELESGTIVHLYQVKHAMTFENSRSNFPSNEIDKVLSYISDMLPRMQSSRGR